MNKGMDTKNGGNVCSMPNKALSEKAAYYKAYTILNKSLRKPRGGRILF
jgi:hypothetical protein